MLTYIDVSAQFAGVDPNFSFYLLSIANAGSAVGRLGGGILSDVVGMSAAPAPINFPELIVISGALNIMIPATFVAGILTYAWPFATSKGGFIVIAIIYGFVEAPIFIRLVQLTHSSALLRESMCPS